MKEKKINICFVCNHGSTSGLVKEWFKLFLEKKEDQNFNVHNAGIENESDLKGISDSEVLVPIHYSINKSDLKQINPLAEIINYPSIVQEISSEKNYKGYSDFSEEINERVYKKITSTPLSRFHASKRFSFLTRVGLTYSSFV